MHNALLLRTYNYDNPERFAIKKLFALTEYVARFERKRIADRATVDHASRCGAASGDLSGFNKLIKELTEE